MRAFRSLLTPPPISLSTIYSDESGSVLTDEVSFDMTDSDVVDTTDTEDVRDIVKPLPALPPRETESSRPPLERRSTSTSTRPADDLLEQADVLRDAANAARSRRPRFRGDNVPYDRRRDERKNRTSANPYDLETSHGSATVQTGTYLRNSVAETRRHSLGGSTFCESEATGVGRPPSSRLSSSLAGPKRTLCPSEEKPQSGRKKGSLLRGPLSFFRRFLCIGHFDNAGPFEFVVPRSSVRRADTESCARFDALMAAEPLVTRRIRLDPRSSVLSPVEVDIH